MEVNERAAVCIAAAGLMQYDGDDHAWQLWCKTCGLTSCRFVVCSSRFFFLTTRRLRESSLHVTNTTYSGLQEHRIIVSTATGQKAKPKVHLSMEGTVTGNSSKAPEACRRETEEHKLETAV
jgi:hypothetical protein